MKGMISYTSKYTWVKRYNKYVYMLYPNMHDEKAYMCIQFRMIKSVDRITYHTSDLVIIQLEKRKDNNLYKYIYART